MGEQARAGGGAGEVNPLKLLLDFGPPAAFLVVYFVAERIQPEAGIYWATGILMPTTVAALVASRVLLGRFSVPALVTAVLVLVFGGLTIGLHDRRFIYIKPTIIYLLFAGALAFGLATRRPLLKLLVAEALQLTDEGWRKLTFRWLVFFVAMAVLNEIVWRNFPESVWAWFKFPGILVLTFVFAIAQMGLIRRYEPKADGTKVDA
jgi:intracellular septation protein